MIVTVTMNPAIDKTAEVDTLQLHALNRLSHVEVDIGGKGINVSKTISCLGGSSTACGFLAGSNGRLIETALHAYSVVPDFIHIEGESRTNLKIVEHGGALTELNESGPVVSETQLAALAEKLVSLARPDTLFVFAGSTAPGMAPNVYCRLISAVKAQGARVLLDADGACFREAVEAIPDCIKPNGFELSQYFGQPESTDTAVLVGMGQRLLAKGIGLVCISRGSRGALFLRASDVFCVSGLCVEAHSTVGAGDAMVAALAYGMDSGLPLEETIALCTAASAGAVTTLGTKPPSQALVQALLPQVKITRIQ